MVSSVLERKPRRNLNPEIGRLVLLGLALSIDNLVIGFALGSERPNIVAAVALITVVSTGLSLIGLEIGRRLGDTFGESSEILGGLILILLGVAVGTGLV